MKGPRFRSGLDVTDRQPCRRHAISHARAWGLGGAAAVLPLGGCSRSPSQDILGSFFPSWLLCLGLGLLAVVGCRLALGWLGVREDVPVPLLTYLAVALAVTFVVWLLWFGH